jgi:hypothetical protein
MSTPSEAVLRQRLDKLHQQKAEIEAQISRKAGLLRQKERKRRDQQLIQNGGLVNIAQLDDVNKGLLLGLLLDAARRLQMADTTAKVAWKAEGDRVLAERAAKSGKTGKKQTQLQTHEGPSHDMVPQTSPHRLESTNGM